MIPRVLTTFRDDPSGRVGDTEVENLSGLDEVVERLHDLLNGRGVVLRRNTSISMNGLAGRKTHPEVNVEDVDVVRAEFLQRGVDGDVHYDFDVRVDTEIGKVSDVLDLAPFP